MNIAVLSGKGGTGKTTISTNLALLLRANYIDCDVEEPNGFLFLNPNIDYEENVKIDYPVIDKDKCKGCRLCVDACNFNALAKVKDKIKVFEKLCHSCGSCKFVCKFDALKYKKRDIGKIQMGSNDTINCSRGILNISEPMAVPIIKTLLDGLDDKLNIIDCPPGTSCNVVNSLRYVNRAILVTEPSEFGLHDLKMAIELVKMYDIPFGIIINKDDDNDNIIKRYCRENNINLLGAIPYNKDIAKLYSKGDIICKDYKYKNMFENLLMNIKEALLWN